MRESILFTRARFIVRYIHSALVRETFAAFAAARCGTSSSGRRRQGRVPEPSSSSPPQAPSWHEPMAISTSCSGSAASSSSPSFAAPVRTRPSASIRRPPPPPLLPTTALRSATALPPATPFSAEIAAPAVRFDSRPRFVRAPGRGVNEMTDRR